MNLDYNNDNSFDAAMLFPSAQNQEEAEPLCFLGVCDRPQENRTEFKQRVYGLISQLDSDVFRERESAQAALMGMDRSVLPMFERELRNPRSVEVEHRLRNIYRNISGSERVQFEGNVGRDGVGRLREVRDNMTVAYRDGAFPSTNNEIDYVGYSRAGGWSVVRQGDGTYNIYQDGAEDPMESGVRATIDHRTGNVRAVLRDGSPMIIPPAGPRWWYREGDTPPPVQDQ